MATSKEIETLALPDNSKADFENINNDMVFSEKSWKLKTFCCIKCSKVALDHSFANCAHVFCKNCFQHLLDRPCPDCQQIIIEKYEDPRFKDELMQLKVECINKTTGCKEILKLSNYKTHMENCTFYTDSSVTPQQLNKLNKLIMVLQSDLNAQFSEIQKINAANEELSARLDEIQKTTTAKHELNIQESNFIKLRITLVEKSLSKDKVRTSCQQREDNNKTVEITELLQAEVDMKLATFNYQLTEITTGMNMINESIRTEMDKRLATVNNQLMEIASRMAMANAHLMELRTDMEKRSAKVDKQLSDVNSQVNEIISDFPNKADEIMNMQVESKKKFEESVLTSKWWEEKDELNENVFIYDVAIPNIESIIMHGFANPGAPIWISPFCKHNDMTFCFGLFILKDIEKLVLTLKVIKWGNDSAYFCKAILLSHSEDRIKNDVIRSFLISSNNYNHAMSLVPLTALTNSATYSRKTFIANNEIFVENNSISVRIVFHSTSFICKFISLNSGKIIWQLPHYLDITQDAINGITKKVYSPPFYTSENGYKMQASLNLSNYMHIDKEYISLEVEFLDGEFDDILPMKVSYHVQASILNQMNTFITKELTWGYEYYPQNACETEGIEADEKSCHFTKFVNKQSVFLNCDCLFIIVEVDILDAYRDIANL